jgi:FHA domain
MAVLRLENGATWCGLHADHVVGRSSRCELQIDEGYVSAQHAAIRWTGGGWEIKDLGSRNGTLVDGAPVEPGRYVRLNKGMALSFGRSTQTWVLEDDTEPRVMAIPLGGGAPVFVEDDLLAIPSSDAPEAVIVRGSDGSWQLERPDGVLTRIEHDETFLVSGGTWLFCSPNLIKLTSALEDRPSLRNAYLNFSVSADEEHVEVTVGWAASSRHLGSRTHNYILVTLARHRLEDITAGIPAAACGWVYQEDLIRELGTSSTQLNVDIFRIRKQFSTLDLSETAAVIERRPRTKQLRIGIANLVVRRI